MGNRIYDMYAILGDKDDMRSELKEYKNLDYIDLYIRVRRDCIDIYRVRLHESKVKLVLEEFRLKLSSPIEDYDSINIDFIVNILREDVKRNFIVDIDTPFDVSNVQDLFKLIVKDDVKYIGYSIDENNNMFYANVKR